MKTLKNQQLNVYDAFIDYFNKLSNKSILLWLEDVYSIHYDERFHDINIEVQNAVASAIEGVSLNDTTMALVAKLHELAKAHQNDIQFYFRALAHMVSAIHDKKHGLNGIDYIIRMIQFQTKSNDRVVGERLRQIQLIYHQK